MWKNSSKREIKNFINEIKLYKNANFNSILNALNAMIQNDDKKKKESEDEPKVSEEDSLNEKK